jgi:hypothetical protein
MIVFQNLLSVEIVREPPTAQKKTVDEHAGKIVGSEFYD